MLQLNPFIVIFTAVVAVASVSARRCGDSGRDYFCGKKLNQIHIVMTHNSLSHRNGVARNQNYDLVRQFKDGVRGFNLDLYDPDRSDTELWTKHGAGLQSYNPTDQIKKLVAELNKNENRDEVIVIQVQNGKYPNVQRLDRPRGVDSLTNLFGTLLIQDKDAYLDNNSLDLAIHLNERVYLTTDQEGYTSKHFFKSGDVIGENGWDWNNCRRTIESNRDEMPIDCRDYPSGIKCKRTNNGDKPILLMNSFCGRAKFANRKCGILGNAERFKNSGNFEGNADNWPNIIMVDRYHYGGSSVFGAQDCLRRNAVGRDDCKVCGKFDWDPTY